VLTAATVWKDRAPCEFSCTPLSISHLAREINPGLPEPLAAGSVPQEAAVCGVLSGHAMHREDGLVRKPNGDFCSMFRKADRGELHLHTSVFAILTRGRGRCDA
jgi:hypothetical protein